ncbi:hypothetical protein BKA57DRAFT_82107 [Linnemannia elongata]|nr:hypothetical protein BKA57DRAFT_82107 [Linnemannia elongata]
MCNTLDELLYIHLPININKDGASGIWSKAIWIKGYHGYRSLTALLLQPLMVELCSIYFLLFLFVCFSREPLFFSSVLSVIFNHKCKVCPFQLMRWGQNYESNWYPFATCQRQRGKRIRERGIFLFCLFLNQQARVALFFGIESK